YPSVGRFAPSVLPDALSARCSVRRTVGRRPPRRGFSIPGHTIRGLFAGWTGWFRVCLVSGVRQSRTESNAHRGADFRVARDVEAASVRTHDALTDGKP